MAEYYPPVQFHFSVDFSSVSDQANDTRFQSVGGLNVEMETETVKEGGENRFTHLLPLRSKYQNLTLKRGLLRDSKLIEWMLRTFNDLVVEPKDIVVKLLNEEHEPLMSWNIVRAWPVKWNVSDFNAEESKVVIETLEIHYQYFTVEQ
jgi:phage tail-like protein